MALNDFVDACINDGVLFHLVICPNSLKRNWVIEAQTFGLNANSYVWPEDVPDDPRKLKPPAQIIMNYEALLASGGDWLGKFLRMYDGRIALTCDETSRIKNFKAATTKRTIAINPYAKRVRALSGTPMVQNVMDYWSQLRLIGQLSGVNPYQFRNTYGVMGGYLGKQVIGLKNKDSLQKILDGCSYTVSEKVGLPPKVFPPPRQVKLSGEQARYYKEMQNDFLVMIEDEAVPAPMVITQMMKLQQISSGFLLDEKGAVHSLVTDRANPKAQVVAEVAEECGGKLLVFCHFKHSVDVLVNVLADFSPAVMRGGSSSEDLERHKKAFNENPSCRVMIAQASVGGMGHTLLGGAGRDRCATTCFYENTFALGDRLQAEDRNHRHGQDADSVTYVDIVASPVEMKIVRALQKKQDLIRSLREKA